MHVPPITMEVLKSFSGAEKVTTSGMQMQSLQSRLALDMLPRGGAMLHGYVDSIIRLFLCFDS